jgi:glycosyltransferase involved in cell wall biosynthesis
MRHHCKEVKVFRSEYPDLSDKTKQMVAHADYPLQVLRHQSLEAIIDIQRALNDRKFDLIHIEGYYLMHFLPQEPHIPVILADQNIEYLLCKQRFKISKTYDEQVQNWREYQRTKRWEREAWRRANMCITVTDDDQHHIQAIDKSIPVVLIPNGIDHQLSIDINISYSDDFSAILEKSLGPRILLIGNFEYQPNVDAVHYFIQDIFPLIQKSIPDAQLFIVGNSPPADFRQFEDNQNIVITGFVKSLLPFLEVADVFVCPLRIGGGIKVKILEALYSGKAIVSTSIGTQGLGYEVHDSILVSNNSVNFAQNVIMLLNNLDKRVELQNAARSFGQRLPVWDRTTSALMKCYRQVTSQQKNTNLQTRDAATF